MITFMLPDGERSVAAAAGITALADRVSICPFNIGDTITFPAARAVTFRVVSRQYQANASGDEEDWIVGLELSAPPF